ncbi:phytoene desaturase family protein [uncultured Microbacterium sp.]|uniref:phytoene desaturase family protein n=1 Tax=uncultured Microbacterium sp. TaxID=191216 RepID=UPI0025E938E8|nr:phytoene desaturase family protein [uncultured Microbacterium sp.]
MKPNRRARELIGARVSIVGGGVSGLATAALLAANGCDVDVFEARDELGGRAGSWERDGFRWDTGPSWYLMPEVFEHYFRLLGTSAAEQLKLIPLDPAYRVYVEQAGATQTGSATTTTTATATATDEHPIDIRSGAEHATALFESIEPGAGSTLSGYLESAREAYDLAVGRFLYDSYASTQGLRDPALVKRLPVLGPLLTGTLARFVDRRFTDTRLRRILEYPAVFLGGSPFGVPALYHLMSHLDLGDRVLYPQGGFTTLVRSLTTLALKRGVRIHTGTPVVAIETARGAGRGAHVTGVRVSDRDAWRGATRTVPADIVVGAADLHHVEHALLPARLRTHSARSWRKRTPSPGALLLLLGVRGELPELAHHTLLFTDGWRENFDQIDTRTPLPGLAPDPASVYVCRPSASDPNVAPAGHENLFVLVPMPADEHSGRGGVDGTGDERVEQAADRVIAQISAWAGIPDLAERVVVRRTISPEDFATELHTWRGNALGLAHTLRQSAIFRPRNASAKVDGLYFAGADVLPGIGLPLCLISAELVLKRLRGDTSAGRTPEPGETAPGSTGTSGESDASTPAPGNP